MVHEFSHSVVARRYGLPMKGITLFIFGGVAEMGEEPGNAKTEFLMAIAGPIASIVIGAVFYLIYQARSDLVRAGGRGDRLSRLDQLAAGGLQSDPGLPAGWRTRVAVGSMVVEWESGARHTRSIVHRLWVRRAADSTGRVAVMVDELYPAIRRLCSVSSCGVRPSRRTGTGIARLWKARQSAT